MTDTRENPNLPAPPPRESMVGSVTRDAGEASGSSSSSSSAPALGETLANPHPPAAPPRESMAAAVTQEAPARELEPEKAEPESSTTEAAPSRVSALTAVPKPLPALPRLRVSYYYTTRAEKRGPELCCELLLMGEKREHVHREVVYLNPGDVLAKLHGIFMAVVGTAAVQAGSARSATLEPAPSSEAAAPSGDTVIQNTGPDPTAEA